MSYSLDAITADCYPDTTCLINKLDIRDEKQLAIIEAGITMLRDSELSEQPIQGAFDFAHYRAIHRYLFGEIYAWAGEIRTVNISKKGTHFAEASEIEDVAQHAFERLRQNGYLQNMRFDAFVENIVDFYAVINALHPFREGNGRTQRVFFTQLIRNAGYDIDFSAIDPDELMIATIYAANGVEDHLRRIFSEAIHKYDVE
ncbi:MAG: Fic family protein [Oscillospiraceae bacterium]|nr:Fic family protein [Oscillospiraceae bacterium]